ncbi:hypothetical protein NDU88_001507 [Pleurodeles waltl]|uniref:Uncharacterized protein n=1 Tax=Pleurodeles waltl TaxID=8319 RepID=A0AAV7ML72_PLEWA|nr:hypothetical protein NDU88_001507 [Pleurodeles waltl]
MMGLPDGSHCKQDDPDVVAVPGSPRRGPSEALLPGHSRPWVLPAVGIPAAQARPFGLLSVRCRVAAILFSSWHRLLCHMLIPRRLAAVVGCRALRRSRTGQQAGGLLTPLPAPG